MLPNKLPIPTLTPTSRLLLLSHPFTTPCRQPHTHSRTARGIDPRYYCFPSLSVPVHPPRHLGTRTLPANPGVHTIHPRQCDAAEVCTSHCLFLHARALIPLFLSPTLHRSHYYILFLLVIPLPRQTTHSESTRPEPAPDLCSNYYCLPLITSVYTQHMEHIHQARRPYTKEGMRCE